MPLVTTPIWFPQSDADKEAVARQLEKLFAHHTFRSSRRCPAFLQYIVEHQLKGETQHLKERIIGAEVFGRNADYDTSADPVVRTTASEVRKRIAQYYQEPGHEEELRIELPLGSYAAEFHLPAGNAHLAEQSPAPIRADHGQERNATLVKNTGNFGAYKKAIAATICAALAIGAVIFWAVEGRSSITKRFWNPVVVSHNPVLVCLNTWDLSPLLRDSKSPLAPVISQVVDSNQWLPINDAVAFSQLAGFLGTMRSGYLVQGARSTTLSDLMQAPSVLIGVFGNPWTQRVTDPLRFHFVREPAGTDYIEDRKTPGKRYSIEKGNAAEGAKDYAIVGRIYNPATGQVTFVVAGLDAAGTTAASEFVTTPRYMDSLKNALPAISSSNNVEALISVRVIDGRPGAPYVESAEAW